jgi:pyridoxal phosphate enzyme (YggS family)
VRLVAVSKTKPAKLVREAIDAGATTFGENYIQEAREKIAALADLGVSWHFIGHLQTNKAKYAVRLFDLIHSVDSLKVAKALNKQAAKNDIRQDILVQVNISGEATKSGIETDECVKLVEAVAGLKHLCLKGLMTMPPYFDRPEKARPFFTALRELRDHIRRAAIPGVTMDELSMGMTGDFEAAIQEGSTMVRIGTALFGERT